MCIDDEYDIKGDFNTSAASNLMIVFERCKEEESDDPGSSDKKPTCESREKIDEVLKGSYIVVFENTETYNHQNNPATDEMLIRKSRIRWYALSVNEQIDFQKKIAQETLHYH